MKDLNLHTVVSAALILIVLMVSSCSVITIHEKMNAAKEMQKNGADPLDIPCATEQGTERYCELRSASRKNKDN